MTSTLFVILGALAAILGLAFLRGRLRRITIFEHERGLRYTQGRLRGIMEPGQYWLWTPSTAVRTVDTRARIAPVAGQEVLSADGVALKVSLVATYRIVDPVKAVTSVESFENALYTSLQLALRAIIGGSPVDDVLQRRSTLGAELLQRVAPTVVPFGLELIEADIKDLTLPGELKKLFAQVVRARQDGLAALERARGESAALRSLANAASMIERNPSLMQLRLLQVLGEKSGNTIVLGVPGASGPIPIRGADQQPVLPEAPEPGDA